jgi:hypothetical protein
MRSAIVPLVVLLLAPTPARPADAVHTAEVPLSKPKKATDKRAKEPFDKAVLRVWIPDGVKTVRGAVFNPFNEKQVEQTHWQEAARLWDFAVVGADYFGVDKKDFGPTLAAGMAKLGRELNRPELEHVPFLMIGMSAGAGMCMTFADQLPDRTIAVAAVCLEVGPFSDATRKIPVLTIYGEKDGKQGEILAKKLPEERKQGALWATAVQWGRRHEFGAANNLVMPFFDTCLRHRYPVDADPTHGPVKLWPLGPRSGCLVGLPNETESQPWVHQLGGKGAGLKVVDPLAGWLPDGLVCDAWAAFVRKNNELTLREPKPLGDGNPFVTYKGGKKVKVVVGGLRGYDWVDVYGRFFRTSARKDPAADEGTVETIELDPGIYPLVVTASGPPGTPPRQAKLVTVIVSK